MGLYISLPEVKVRLLGKVAFDDSGADENKMSAQLANMLINQAEGDVELDLSPRYAAPFQTEDGRPFSFLPPRPTKQVIKTLCLNKACLYILDTDFGRGSAINGEEYAKGLIKQYDALVKRMVGVIGDEEVDAFRQWKYPPLPGLRFCVSNGTSDDGFAGQIFHTGHMGGEYAADSVNDPSVTFWNASEADIVDGSPGGFNPYNPNGY